MPEDDLKYFIKLHRTIEKAQLFMVADIVSALFAMKIFSICLNIYFL